MSITLSYWDIRGLAEPSRLLLRYADADWTDDRQADRDSWLAKKFDLGLEFPNLPYLIDGDVKLTQSLAIIRYLGRKFNLAGTNEAEQVRCDVAEQEIMDMKMAQGKLCYNPEMEKLKAEYLINLVVKLGLMEKFLGSGPWVAGEKMTYVDFLAYEYFDHIRRQFPDNFKDTANINAFMARFEALQSLKKWFDSDLCKAPAYIHGPMASWNGKD